MPVKRGGERDGEGEQAGEGDGRLPEAGHESTPLSVRRAARVIFRMGGPTPAAAPYWLRREGRSEVPTAADIFGRLRSAGEMS